MKRTTKDLLREIWWEQSGVDIAEYAVVLAVVLVMVLAAVRLVVADATNVFSAASLP